LAVTVAASLTDPKSLTGKIASNRLTALDTRSTQERLAPFRVAISDTLGVSQ
jgi:hypothetical protein